MVPVSPGGMRLARAEQAWPAREDVQLRLPGADCASPSALDRTIRT
jgi:hypothetical protein